MTDQQPGSEPPGSGPSSSGASGYGAGPERPDFYAPQSGYGPYGPYAYRPVFAPSDPQAKSNATVAFVINLVLCVMCCGVLAVPSVILGAIAMSKADLEPESARNLTKWAWISLGIAAGVVVLIIAVVVIIAVAGGFDASSSDH